MFLACVCSSRMQLAEDMIYVKVSFFFFFLPQPIKARPSICSSLCCSCMTILRGRSAREKEMLSVKTISMNGIFGNLKSTILSFSFVDRGILANAIYFISLFCMLPLRKQRMARLKIYDFLALKKAFSVQYR